MFAIAENPIDEIAARAALRAEEAGGYVSFEGWVRCSNLERAVTRLEFEADAQLAANEFAQIEAEAFAAWDILALSCIHRVGCLEISDMAVWIGVTAKHRDPAFQACRYIIDELKTRLPIWKKEHYTDGDSGWINHP